MEKTITIKSALGQGFKYFFIKGGDSEQIYSIKEEAQDHLNDGEELILAEEAEHMILDAQSIFENACDDLHESSYDNVYNGPEYKLFDQVCQYLTQELRSQTQCYRETDIEIRAE